MTTIFTDSFTGTDGAVWSATNWTTFIGTSQTMDINSNRGRIFSSSTASSSYNAAALDKFGARGDQEILVTITTNNASQNIFVGVKANATAGGIGNITSGAILQIRPAASGTVLLQRSASVSTTLITDARTLALNTSYYVRLQIIGTTAKYKIWLTTVSEPATWDGTATTAALPNGSTYLGRQYTTTAGGAAVYFDDVTVTDTATGVAGGYTAQAMFATADAPGGIYTGSTQRIPVSDDAYTVASTPSTTQDYTYVQLLASNVGLAFFKAPAPVLGSNTLVTKKLYIYNAATVTASSLTLSLYSVDAAWSEATLTHANKPATTFVRTQTFSIPAGTGYWFAIDVTNVDNGNGVAITLPTGTGAISVESSEATTAANWPYMLATVAPAASASYNAQVSTASGLMPDPVTFANRTVSASGQPMTASATAPDAVGAGTVLINRNVTAERMDAYADTPNGTFSLPANTVGNPMIATALAVQPQAGTTMGIVVGADPMEATSKWARPTVNGNTISIAEDEDRYFARVMSDVPRVWMRLADKGSTAADRVGLVNTAGTYHGVLTGQFEAPEGRHSVFFNGSASLEQTPPGNNMQVSGVLLSTLEFSFRTSKANTFILASEDGPGALSNPAKEVYLRDGRVAYRTHYDPNSLGIQLQPTEFRGFKNLADGQWHHVVIKGGTYRFAERGVEIWVDGKLEVRRVNANAMWGFPDWIGSRPAVMRDRNIGALPGSLNFVGDMSEVVFYGHDDVTDDDVARHYYAFMGWNPIEATPMDAFAFTPAGTSGKGNQKRALYLWWSREQDMYNVGGDGHNNKMSFDPIPWAPRSTKETVDYAGYKVFVRSVVAGPDGAYRDEVTDAVGLIDLKRDVDLANYDVIMFADWPDEGAEFDVLRETLPQFDEHYERLTKQLKDAAVDGMGLFVTVPRLAIELGVVDRVENVPTLGEQRFSTGQGAALGYYDYGSAYKFPWNIRGSAGMEGNALVLGSPFNGQAVNRDPVFLSSKAFYYEDTNRNNRFRVRAFIEGLTDIPSYMVADQVHQRDYDVYGWDGIARKYLHRMDGLRIGDEYIFHGAEIFDNPAADYSDVRLGRYYGYMAAPVANVKAGTVVTTFGAKHWLSDAEVDNPYRNYATTIVVRPGDTLNGRSINGKIYVNFTEAPARQREFVLKQVLPTNNVWPARYNPDTAEQKEWEYSWTRHTLTNTTSQSSPVSYVDPLGNTVTILTPGNDLTMVRSSEIFPLEAFPSYNMNMRGLFWLREGAESPDGSTTVAAGPMVANAVIPNATSTVQRDGGYRAEPMNVLAQVTKVAEDKSGAADIRTLPMTAAVTWTGYGRTIAAGPMTADAAFVENFEAVHTTGEQIVLTLHHFDVVLFIKEEA